MSLLAKIFTLIQVVITVLGFVILTKGRDFNSAASFAIGGVFVLVNVLSWAFLVSRILKKKLIALSVTIIVFKYAILGVILYKLLTLDWLDRVWFSVGLGSLLVSTLLFVSFTFKNDTEEENFE
jgi:hypothetical protein